MCDELIHPESDFHAMTQKCKSLNVCETPQQAEWKSSVPTLIPCCDGKQSLLLWLRATDDDEEVTEDCRGFSVIYVPVQLLSQDCLLKKKKKKCEQHHRNTQPTFIWAPG